MPSANKLFVYVDKSTAAVLHTKESRKFDFFLESDEIATHLVISSDRESLTPYSQSYSPFEGLREIRLGPEDRARCEISKARIEAYIYLSTLTHMIVDQIHSSFSLENLITVNLDVISLRTYVKLATDEKDIAVGIVQRFAEEIRKQLNRANSLEKISELIYNIQHNVNLGVYSATNQERKRIDFRK